MTQMNEFEVRVALIEHIANMLFEMTDPDITKTDEQRFRTDYEVFASHLIDSLQIGVEESNGVTHKVLITPMSIKDYVDKVLAEGD